MKPCAYFRTPAVLAALSVSMFTAWVYTGQEAIASDHLPPLPVSQLITPRAVFTDDVAVQFRSKLPDYGTAVANLRDASNVAVARVTLEPGAVFPWHTHPGPVIVNVTEGDFVLVLAADCVDRLYMKGEAFVDLGVEIHTGYNPSASEETVLIATFFGAPDEGPVSIPVPGAANDLSFFCP